MDPDGNNRITQPLIPSFPFLMNTIRQGEGIARAMFGGPSNMAIPHPGASLYSQELLQLYAQPQLSGNCFLPSNMANMNRFVAPIASVPHGLFNSQQNLVQTYGQMINQQTALQNALAASYALAAQKPSRKRSARKEPQSENPTSSTNSSVPVVPIRPDFSQSSSNPIVQVKREVITPHDIEEDDEIEVLEVREHDKRKTAMVKETQVLASEMSAESTVLVITRNCVIHPLYQCKASSCSMTRLSLGAVCLYLKIACPKWARGKMVNSAAAIACSIAILEDNRFKDTEEKMSEELKKTFRFISTSCLARAWKVVAERCVHFEQIRKSRQGVKFRFEGNCFFNLSNVDVEEAFKLSMEDLSSIPPSENDLVLYPMKRMANLKELKTNGVVAVGYNNFDMCVHSASAYAPVNVRYIVMILPEKNEWRGSYVQLQTLEQIAKEKCCKIVFLCPPVYGIYHEWKNNIATFEKILKHAQNEWIRKFIFSRIQLIGPEEGCHDNLERYFGSLGVNTESALGSEQLTAPMIIQYFRHAHDELRHRGLQTNLEFSDNLTSLSSRNDSRRRTSRKRKSVDPGPSIQSDDEDMVKIPRRIDSDEVVVLDKGTISETVDEDI